ncbi:phosphoribosylanthranilate isomerase [Paenibacillus sp. JCM 10914]|uniref:phosphoribosylanthranilate isomerase n=1 Tax=Paenibacillus sp. JCM 10914 TaxID=1236974 RepID=UPI0003CCB9BD|nr:phosphoribosylanthranilate isomerase [Paenibacillus sp. JCM 10914]GAE04678.1 phosphoribosylanthranilate isomerase [Paenibacillus sp. JCM 10914]
MPATALKICGLQSVEVLKSMVNLPVDYIGFVFAKSRRQVTPQQAALLIGVLQEWDQDKIPASAGVLVNPDMNELEELLNVAALDVIQLHGQESPQFCREVKERFPVSVFKVVSIEGSRSETDRISELDAYAGAIDGLLLDTYDPVYGGGSGKTFAWDLIPAYQRWASRHRLPLFVAGGLDADNVAQLIDQYAPDGVDVSSGVESEPGVKDIDKVNAFVERVKEK